jgi:Ser/Thr protein kinase RdoA (MazF antagonist)
LRVCEFAGMRVCEFASKEYPPTRHSPLAHSPLAHSPLAHSPTRPLLVQTGHSSIISSVRARFVCCRRLAFLGGEKVEPIRVARSFVAADALAELITAEYELPGPINCKLFTKLVRTQDNDHYLVTAGDGRQYVARVYQQGDSLQRQESDYEFEMEWLNFLRSRNIPVSGPLCRNDNRYLGRLLAPEGVRYYALFDLAKGAPLSLKKPEQLYIFGAKMAEIHAASNEFHTPHHRQPIDLAFLVDRPVEKLRHFWSQDRMDDLDLVVSTAEEARHEVVTLLERDDLPADAWGPIGGDFHSSNVHFHDNKEPTFFNFDLCGPGWRAYDIAAFLLNTNLIHTSTKLSEAFFAGYYSVRPLARSEHEAVAPFITLRRIWLTGSFTNEEGLVGHTFIGAV